MTIEDIAGTLGTPPDFGGGKDNYPVGREALQEIARSYSRPPALHTFR
jgi:hypothetical protein